MKNLFIVLILCLFTTNSYGLTASWTPSENADGYYLYIQNTETGIEKYITFSPDMPSSEVVEIKVLFSVSPGNYKAEVSAYNQAGEGERSNPVFFTVAGYTPKPSDPPEPMPEKPAPPTGLSLIGQGFALIWAGIRGLI